MPKSSKKVSPSEDESVSSNSTAEAEAQGHAFKTQPEPTPEEFLDSAIQTSETKTVTADNSSRSKFMLSGKIVMTICVILALLSAVGTAGFFYFKAMDAQGKLEKSSLGASTIEENQALIEKVGKVAELPTGEMPQIATVSDVSELSDQPFFNRAKNGDKLLIYTNSGKAFLYRPDTNKIVEIGPIVKTDQTAQASESATLGVQDEAVVQVKTVILNGTKEKGLAKTVQEELLAEKLPVEVVSVGNSTAPETYAETIVIDLTGKNSKSIEEIAKAVGGKTGKLPEDETAPENAEVLIIAGEDFNND